jgi:hypothetical protein
MARDPVIDPRGYIDEAMEALCLVLPDEFPGTHLCLLVMDVLLGLLDGEPVRQSDLDALYEEFDEAAAAMKT